MVRQVHAVALELPGWNCIGNGDGGSKRIIKGQLRLRGREEKRKLRKKVERNQNFFITTLKYQGERSVQRESLSVSVRRKPTQKAYSNKLVISVFVMVTGICQVTALPLLSNITVTACAVKLASLSQFHRWGSEAGEQKLSPRFAQ